MYFALLGILGRTLKSNKIQEPRNPFICTVNKLNLRLRLKGPRCLGICGWTKDKLFHKAINDLSVDLIFSRYFIFSTEKKARELSR